MWRNDNSHNETSLGLVLGKANICVGNHTYGKLNVLNSSDDCWLRIGHFCSIAQDVTFIVCADHPTNTISTYPFKVMCLRLQQYEAISKGDIVVDDDVWIGHGAIILSGVHIGQGVVVAAGSVVTKDVPPYAIVGGVPAKVIKYRFSQEMIKGLMSVDYSKLNQALICEHVDDLYTELLDIKQIEWMPHK